MSDLEALLVQLAAFFEGTGDESGHHSELGQAVLLQLEILRAEGEPERPAQTVDAMMAASALSSVCWSIGFIKGFNAPGLEHALRQLEQAREELLRAFGAPGG